MNLKSCVSLKCQKKWKVKKKKTNTKLTQQTQLLARNFQLNPCRASIWSISPCNTLPTSHAFQNKQENKK